jgi:hypothetical protein
MGVLLPLLIITLVTYWNFWHPSASFGSDKSRQTPTMSSNESYIDTAEGAINNMSLCYHGYLHYPFWLVSYRS